MSASILDPDDEVIQEVIEKRKHAKNPFDERYLSIALSEFKPESFDQTMRDEEESDNSSKVVRSTSVNVNIRYEIIKEMVKQTVKEVDTMIHRFDQDKASSQSKKHAVQPSADDTPRWMTDYDRSKFIAYKERNEKDIEMYSTIEVDSSHTSSSHVYLELPSFVPNFSSPYYVLNREFLESSFKPENREDGLVDRSILEQVFFDFSDVMSMPEDKLEEYFEMEGISIYEEVDEMEEVTFSNCDFGGECGNEDNLNPFSAIEEHDTGGESTEHEMDFSKLQQEVENDTPKQANSAEKKTNLNQSTEQFKYFRVVDMDHIETPPKKKSKSTLK